MEFIDTDFHGLAPSERRTADYTGSPVFLAENVFIGNNVKILKGVSLGVNTVVANGAIVPDHLAITLL